MWTLAGENLKEGRTTGRTPLYRKIIALVEQGIESGALSGGERLPSERALSDLLGVNRSTVLRALDELADRGVLLRKQGSGTFVNHEKWGLQNYPVLNWRPAPGLQAGQGGNSYGLRVRQMQAEAVRGGAALWDFSGSDLPADLLPEVALPEFSWQDLITQEMEDESSHVGLHSFRQAVRGHLRRSVDLEVGADEILITSGAQQALFLITQCLLRPGDAIGIEAPSYFYSLPVFQAAGLRLYAIATDEEGITPEGLEALAARRTLRMIFLNPVFQNPTGHAMSHRRKRQILELCAAKHIPVVEDDAYSALAFSRGPDILPLKRQDARHQVLYIGSLSSYVGKNIRAGWLVAPRAIVHKLAEMRQQIDAGLSVLPQLLAKEYLTGAADGHQECLRRTLAERAAGMTAWLESRYPGVFQYRQPQGGFYLYLRCPEASDDEYTRVLHDLLRQRVLVAQGRDFGDNAHSLRLNFGHFPASPHDMP